MAEGNRVSCQGGCRAEVLAFSRLMQPIAWVGRAGLDADPTRRALCRQFVRTPS